ncbi:hypothetical protein CTI12_AA605090 [Artemisia annua]|uniref:Uncharacterized protein n=1 Tax=Artemisia annua TaxID=35608 RepID=A0A2U1KGU2_ARTAN|nr:hypothetical protein CTI12_AA605090 [Artemisia annua]
MDQLTLVEGAGGSYGDCAAVYVAEVELASVRDSNGLSPGACGTFVHDAEIKTVAPEINVSLPRNQSVESS